MSTVSSGLRVALGARRRPDRAKANRLNALLKDIVEESGLLEVRMKLHLVHRRSDPRVTQEQL